jgi:hypothetical protein
MLDFNVVPGNESVSPQDTKIRFHHLLERAMVGKAMCGSIVASIKACLLLFASAQAFSSFFSSRGIFCQRRSQCSIRFMNPRTNEACLYGVPQSGWQSPVWNWGSAVGTGHDCAKICRQKYSSRKERHVLVHQLRSAQGTGDDIPVDFEEVKLILALAWQRGRWDGTDGGKGGYSEVLQYLVAANRYEASDGSDSDMTWSRLWIDDIQKRFHLLQPTPEQVKSMQNIVESVNLCSNSDAISSYDDPAIYRARRQCSGLVLEAMGFIENGC